MKLSLFSQYLQRLEKTTLRNEITEILASLFKEANQREIDKIAYLCLGRLAPSFTGIEFNLAEKTMLKIIALAFNQAPAKVLVHFKKSGDLGLTAFFFKNKKKQVKSKMTVIGLYDQLYKIAKLKGLGSQKQKTKLMADLVRQTPLEFVKYLVRIPIGRLRLGFSDLTVLDALSWMESNSKKLRPQIEAAFSVSADAGLIAKTFKVKGLKGLKAIRSRPGIPILPAKAGRLKDAQSIIDKLRKCMVEPKIDGFRVQIHIDRKPKKGAAESFVKIFSRNLEDTTTMFPDIVKAALRLLSKNKNLKNCILDGEAVGMDLVNNKPLSFQKTAQRKRKYDIGKISREVPLVVFVFDLLFYNNQSLLNYTSKERRKKLAQIFNPPAGGQNNFLRLIPQKIIADSKKLKKEFDRIVAQGWEGVMCKRLDSVYQPGARNFNWVKLKRAMDSQLTDTIDCLVLGYYRGKGKRTDFGIGAFLVGVYDSKKEQFATIAKIGTGLTDAQWVVLRKKCDSVKTEKKPKRYWVDKNLYPDVWCLPKVVVEIKADEITKSPIHTASLGLALRFPRLERFRDKKVEEVTSTTEVLQLFQNQK